MANETVKIYIVDEASQALVGVLVRVFDETGTTLISQNVSALVGSDAIAEFTLSGAATPTKYMIRLSKTGVAFDGSLGDDSKTPQYVEIYSPASGSPTGTNNFTVQGQTFTRPVALDPLLCRASGVVRDLRGVVLRDVDLIFSSATEPVLAGGDLVSGRNVTLYSDSTGYLVVDLYRGAKLVATFAGLEDQPRMVEVPDLPSVNIADLLFPRVKEVTFSPTSVALAVGETKTVTPTVKTSDGRTLEGTATGDVTYTIGDDSVATAGWTDSVLSITGVTAGSTSITVSRRDETVIVTPAAAIVYTALQVTVT